jgi:hypothetical protein
MQAAVRKQEGIVVNASMQFLPDSAEQIAESIDRTGLRDGLYQSVQVAIARANKSQLSRLLPRLEKLTRRTMFR